MLLYDSKLHLFLGKLRSRWIDPYIVSCVLPYGAVEIQDPESSATFKVNGQRLKSFLELLRKEDVECLILCSRALIDDCVKMIVRVYLAPDLVC